MNQFNTPVLFLFFNREDTAIKVFQKIKEVRPPRIYLSSDGPRNSRAEEQEIVINLRAKILSMIDWPCDVFEKFNENNLGCKYAISSALDWFFKNEEYGIILEDDCLPDLSFFTYCEHMLRKYMHDNRIVMVAGYNYFSEKEFLINSDHFFSKYYSIWGWATWRRAFTGFDVEMKSYKVISKGQLRYLFSDYLTYFHSIYLFDKIISNKINTWDIQWGYHCLLNSGLCIVPSKNLISNIGVSGVHSTVVTKNHFLKTYEWINTTDRSVEIYPLFDYDNLLFKDNFLKVSFISVLKIILIKIKLYDIAIYVKNKFSH